MYVRSPRVVFAAMTASHSSAARSEASVPESAVPHAGNSWASAGQIVCVPSRCRYSANALRNDGRNANGPPQKSTGASMSQPCDSVTTVCTATAWKIEAAISSRLTFLANRFWMSVLAKTPHREAIG